MLRGGGLDNIDLKVPPLLKDMSVMVQDESNFQKSLFELGTITPGQRINFCEFITLSQGLSSIHQRDVSATTKNGVPVVLTYQVKWFWIIDCDVYQNNVSPILRRIKVFVLDISRHPLIDYLKTHNEQAQTNYLKQARFKRFIYHMKKKLRKEKTWRNIQLITYDESQVKQAKKTGHHHGRGSL